MEYCRHLCAFSLFCCIDQKLKLTLTVKAPGNNVSHHVRHETFGCRGNAKHRLR